MITDHKKIAEWKAFQRAVSQFTVEPGSAEPIVAMMRLAMEATRPIIRSWAAQWLKHRCNVLIVTDDHEGAGYATPAAATSIL